jgi:hypothetical protein
MDMTLDERRQMIDAALHVSAVVAAAEGHLIEFYWRMFRSMAMPPDISEVELSDRRLAFLAGAKAVFSFTVIASETVPDARWDTILNQNDYRYGNAAGHA